MANAKRDENSVPTLIAVSSVDGVTPVLVYANPTTHRLLVDSASAAGTVTSVSVVSANGFAGTVANATTTPAITLTTTVTGVLIGNGTSIAAASQTGTGSVVVVQNTPTLTTPVIGAATGTSLTVTGVLYSQTSLVLEETGAGTDTITVQAPASIATSYTLTLPVDDGNNGEFLQTNGSGVLAWAAGSSGITVGTTTITGGADTRILYDNAGVVGEYTLTGTGTVVAMATAPTFVTSIATPKVLATANDSGALGASGTAFADLFLADGGVINWVAGNATITHSTGLLTTNVPVTITGVATADGFAPTAITATGNRMYLPAANTLGFAINGSGEVQLTATALSPIVDGGNSLGTTALGWQNLFANTGFVLNIENSDWVATHTAGILTVGTGDLRVTTAGTNSASVVTVGGTQTLTNKTLTSPTLTTPSAFTTGGTITLAENTSLALDPAGSADGKYTGITITGTAGATLAFGDLIYLAVADSKWKLTDADAAATSYGVAIGMCVLAAAADGSATNVLLLGQIRADAKFPTLTVGAAAYVGETAGAVQVAIPTGADNTVRVVGFALTADELYFNPSQDSSSTVA